MLKAAARLAKTHNKELGRCLTLLADGETPPNFCFDYDPRGKVAKAAAKITSTYTKKCDAAPDFGLNGTTAVILAATSESTGIYESLFFDALGTIEFTDAGCIRAVSKLAGKLAILKLKGFGHCVRTGLADESIVDVTGLDACLVSARADAVEKTAKVIAAGATKIGNRCGSGIDFTACPASDPSFATCLDTLVDCRICQMLSAQTGLATSCDDYDNAAADSSCYDVCGNGNVGTGIFGHAEECDDGNRMSGDGCDYNCATSGCGNDVTDPSEFCDNRSGKCIGGEFDGLPCFENAQCGSGFCTNCPSGGCDSCGSCAPAVCCYDGFFGCGLWEYGQGCFGTLTSCAGPECQFSGTCCTGTGTGLGNCSDSASALAECEDFGGQLIPCSQCSPCCQFDGYCTSWGAPDCLEFEGTPVDCSQCWPD